MNFTIITVPMRRLFCTLYKKDLTVSPFCNVNIKVPLNVRVMPLDIHKYKDCDKVIITLTSDSKCEVPNIHYDHTNESVKIYTESQICSSDISCCIEAPIKASLDVTSNNGNITVTNFNGDYIKLKSVHGDIAAAKCYCKEIFINSLTGNITLSDVIQAGKIHLQTGKCGFIVTGKLQGHALLCTTDNGFIRIESCYCSNSSFITKSGNLELDNVHKSCSVRVNNRGMLNMSGFDGILRAYLKEGDASIQVSRIDGDSEIKIENDGTLELKLSEMCIQDTNLTISSKTLDVDKNLVLKLDKEEENHSKLVIDCKKSDVTIKSASWIDKFKIKF